MKSENAALVSVVIPVYNGEKFIADAIRSVQAQTYPHWDLTIGNNRSTDRTLAIAEEFAAQDSRIRVVTYPEFVSVVESHNNAFCLISDEAEYCRILGADDLLFPNSIEEMVRVAEKYPTVGMVVSYVLAGNAVAINAHNYPDTFAPGREIGRLRFLEDVSVFGGPSTSLIRASIVRERRPFYDPINYYGDLEAYLDLLQRHDFGFVHQVLTYVRKGAASRTTSYLDRVHAATAMRLHEITKLGRHYLEPDEYAECLRRISRDYYGFLGENVWELRERDFWNYHLKHVRAMGHPPRYSLIAWYAFLRLLEAIGNPLKSVKSAIRRLSERRARKALKGEESHGPAPRARPQSTQARFPASAATSTVPANSSLP
jgi:glycosyltransferase involved in cell wall biosynthesis